MADCFEFRTCLASRCLCSQNINKYSNKPTKGYKRMIQRFELDLTTYFNQLPTFFFIVQLWILRTKANLETQVNTMISMDCVGRVLFCLSYFYKAWILTLSPLLGLSNLPHPIHCFLGGVVNYVIGIGIIIFNLLTNVLRYIMLYMYIEKNFFS